MYENAGKSIKELVSIIVKIGYALSIISAILIFISGIAIGTFISIILFLFLGAIVGALGCLGAWLSGLWLYAYGEITDRLISIDEKMRKMPESEDGAPAPVSVMNATRSAFAPAPRAAASTPSRWTCPCGRVNAAYVGTCTCGKSKRDAVK